MILTYNFDCSNFSSLKHCSTTFFIISSYVLFADQNHGKPENGISPQIIFHLFPFHDLIYHDTIAFQTGMHMFRKTAGFSIQIRTSFTVITGFRGKSKGLISFSLQKIPDFFCKIFVCHSCGKHLFHIHHVRYFRHTGKKDCLGKTVNLFLTFRKFSYCRGTGPGAAIALTFLFADCPYTFLHFDISCVQQTILKNRILGNKIFKFFFYIHAYKISCSPKRLITAAS